MGGKIHARHTKTGSKAQIPIAASAGEISNFQIPQHIAPGAETISINYDIDDPAGIITVGKLEIFRKRDMMKIGEKDLHGDDLSTASHVIPWDGTLFTGSALGSDFPDGYVTCQHSPYVVRVSIGADAQCAGGSGEGTIAVEASSIALELGPESLCPTDKDKMARNELWALPAAGKLGKVKLKCDLFKLTNAEMGRYDKEKKVDHPSDASFVHYRDDKWFGWGDGPQLPVLASVKFYTSTGAEALAPLAWGNRRVLFDFEEVVEDTSKLAAKVKTFVDDAKSYKKSSTAPEGEGCHADRGGKRGSAARFFPIPSGGWPTTVFAATNRSWAVFSSPSASGKTAGKAAAIFQPARMAGEGYKIVASFDPTLDLDPANSDPNPALDVESGTLQVWKRVEISRILKKKADVPDFAMDFFKKYFSDAYVEMDVQVKKADVFDAASYNSHFKVAAKKAIDDDWWWDVWIDTSVDQWAGGGFAVNFRDYGSFVNAAVEKKKAEYADSYVYKFFSDAKREEYAKDWVKATLKDAKLTTSEKHANTSNGYATAIAIEITKNFMGPGGLSMFEFTHFTSLKDEASSWTVGQAADYGTAPYKAGFICSTLPPATPANYVESTAAHEIGHHLFLCHAPLPSDDWPSGAEPVAHDANDAGCAMGYQDDAYHFCGLCNLRLRGWNHQKLDKDGNNSAA